MVFLDLSDLSPFFSSLWLDYGLKLELRLFFYDCFFFLYYWTAALRSSVNLLTVFSAGWTFLMACSLRCVHNCWRSSLQRNSFSHDWLLHVEFSYADWFGMALSLRVSSLKCSFFSERTVCKVSRSDYIYLFFCRIFYSDAMLLDSSASIWAITSAIFFYNSSFCSARIITNSILSPILPFL